MATTQQATIQDLENIPDSTCRHELIRGEIVEYPLGGGIHSEITMMIVFHLSMHVRPDELGMVYPANTGFIVERNPDTVLAPDAAFLQSSRLPPREERRGYIPVVPDLAVEVVSPFDRMSFMTQKLLLYLNNSAQLVWLIHPDQRIVTVYTPDLAARTLAETDTLDGGKALPDFQLPVIEIFEE